jgi:hypothetical protein
MSGSKLKVRKHHLTSSIDISNRFYYFNTPFKLKREIYSEKFKVKPDRRPQQSFEKLHQALNANKMSLSKFKKDMPESTIIISKNIRKEKISSPCEKILAIMKAKQAKVKNFKFSEKDKTPLKLPIRFKKVKKTQTDILFDLIDSTYRPYK